MKDNDSNDLISFIENPSGSDVLNDNDVLIAALNKSGIPADDHALFRKYISKILSITPYQKTRASFLRSYVRQYQNNIISDGRKGSIVIEITKQCNNGCTSCYSQSSHDKKMDDATLHSIVSLARTGYKHIFITGGEPTLDARVLTLAKTHDDIMFFVFSNGSLIDKDYAKKIAECGNLVPLLSIDGSSEELHESGIKQQGSYRKVTKAIEALNSAGAPWGYISVVTNTNAHDVLDPIFARTMREKGAIVARYLEFVPVGPDSRVNLIPSGEVYFLLEKRKREIIADNEIYMQETKQNKCSGITFFDVDGNIKNCPFFHYAKHNISEGDVDRLIETTKRDWNSLEYKGECPIYSNPRGFKEHLLSLGWRRVVEFEDNYLVDSDIAKIMMDNYATFLTLEENGMAIDE